VLVAGRSSGVREGPEDIPLSGVVAAGEGACDVLQQLQTLLPSVLRYAASTDRRVGHLERLALPILEPNFSFCPFCGSAL
jgi:hypothetical protein